MKTKPMGLTSTQFISYHQIKTEKIDLFEDAFGLYQDFDDVIVLLDKLKPLPGRRLTKKLIDKIRNGN